MGREPLLSYMGYSVSNIGVNEILESKCPDQSITKHLLPETKAIINMLIKLRHITTSPFTKHH